MTELSKVDQMWNRLKEKNEHSRVVIESAQQTINLIDKIVNARIEKGMTQRDLAKICGIKQPALARIETMKVIPQINTLIKIAEAVGVTIVAYDQLEKTLVKTATYIGTVALNMAYNTNIGESYGI